MMPGAVAFTINGAQLILLILDCILVSGLTNTVILCTKVSKQMIPLLFVFSARNKMV